MGRHCPVIILVIGLVYALSSIAGAVDIQFVIASGDVSGVSDTSMDSVADFGIVTLIGSAIDIIWPVPTGQPAATACATGQPSWSTITDPLTAALDGTGMATRSGLLIFKSTSTLLPGCFEITSATQLWDLVSSTLEMALSAGDPLTTVSGKMNVAILGICPPSDSSGDCTTLRADGVTWNAVPGGAAIAMHNFIGAAQQLKDDAAAYATLQSW